MKTIIGLVLCLLWATTSFAGDVARVSGDLKLGGIHFSKDGSIMDTSNGWLKNKGAWDSGILYSAGEIVQIQGVSYICTNANAGTAPPNAAYWTALSGTSTSNMSGTYSGPIVVFFATSSPQVAQITFVLTQIGTALSGTYSDNNNGSGTIDGMVDGNLCSFKFVNTKPGCTSGFGSGMGTIKDNIITIFATGTYVCNFTTQYNIFSASLTKQ